MTANKRQRLLKQEPIKWWRSLPADGFNSCRKSVLRATLSTIAIFDEPTWRSAVGGSAAAAIGLALRLNPSRSTSAAYDLIVTSLAICAADGNAAACIVMSHVLRNIPGAGKAEARIATSWLALAFNDALSRRAQKPTSAEHKGVA
jgi:hypothetical protein